jgi:hypothetical protein|tara:strand:- start:812 stop:1339 length:528 start_codon:yes stop_codon:yes gene_type:complete
MKNDIIKLDNFIDRKTVNSAYLDLRHNFYWTVVSDKPGSNIKKAAFGRGYEHEDLRRALETIPMVSYFDEYIRNSGLPNCNRLRHFYVNCIKPGDQFNYHQDRSGSTVLMYVNPVWKWYWGSGTKFKKGFRTHFVAAKPGRCVCFPGKTDHKPVPPNLLCNDFGRLSIAFQYELN